MHVTPPRLDLHLGELSGDGLELDLLVLQLARLLTVPPAYDRATAIAWSAGDEDEGYDESVREGVGASVET